MIEYKKCNKCKNEFPATPEFFYRDKAIKCGLRAQCKVCMSKTNQKYRKENKEKIKKYKHKYHKDNKEEITKKRREYRKNNPVKIKKQIRDAHLKFRYNISIEDYNEKFKEQDGKCEICGQYETAKSKSNKIRPLCVDHNHITNEVRGLLCNNCNQLIGRSLENSFILIKTINYLKKYKNHARRIKE